MKEELLELLKKYAYKKGEFKLSSGKTSEHYVNCKPVTLSGRGLTLSSLLLLKEVETSYVGGLTLGADPLVSGVALVSALDNRMVNGLIVRKEAKGHGTARFVEGLANFEQGDPVVIVEDTTTTGGSLLTAVERAEQAGLKVVQCVTIVDREEGAVERINGAGQALTALTCRSELLS